MMTNTITTTVNGDYKNNKQQHYSLVKVLLLRIAKTIASLKFSYVLCVVGRTKFIVHVETVGKLLLPENSTDGFDEYPSGGIVSSPVTKTVTSFTVSPLVSTHSTKREK